jgi:hypothetical protein
MPGLTRALREIALALFVLAASALVVAASAFNGATAETPEQMSAVDYGWPFTFAESDATRGASLRELRGPEFTFPTEVPFNPWENPTTFECAAYSRSCAVVSACALAAVGIFRLVRRSVRTAGGRCPRRSVDGS